MSKPKIRKAVIPVAGLGTRMLPATKALRKEMLPVAGKPLIQYAVEEAAASGIETVVLVMGERSALLLEHFERNLSLEHLLERCGRSDEADRLRNLSRLVTFCTVQQSMPLGLGHAIYCAKELVGNELFALLLPDVIIHANQPCTAQLIDACTNGRGNFIAVRRLQQSELQRHGVVAPTELQRPRSSCVFRLSGLVEKPPPEEAPSEFGVCGRYLLEPSVFEYLGQPITTSSHEIQLTDALNLMARDHSVFGVQFEGEHFDAGDPFGFLTANVVLSLKNPEMESETRSFLKSLSRENPCSSSHQNGAQNE